MSSKTHRLYIAIIAILLCMNVALYMGKTKSKTPDEGVIYVRELEQTDGPIDLNSATAEELMSIDGIGPATAEKILNRRKELGGSFYAVEDLLSIEGISEKKYNRFKEMLYVSQ